MFKSEYWYRFPWLLMAAVLALVVTGIIGIYAATNGRADCPPELRALPEKQFIFALIGLGVFAATLVPSYVRLARLSYALYGLSLAVLVAMAVMRRYDIVIPGVLYPINNAYSWIRVPGTGISFQPSELMKIAFIMSLAYYLRYRKNYRTLPGLLVPFVMALVPTAVILYQPDLGTAMLFLPILFMMLFAAGARSKHLATILVLGLVMVPIFYSSMKGYQRMRIDSWLLQGCAERLHFALAEPRAESTDAESADEPAAGKDAGPAAAKDAEPAAEAAGDLRAHEDPRRAQRPSLTADEKTALVGEITSMWRFRLWRLATAISWGKEKPEFAEARQRLFKALDAGTGPESFEALRLFFASLLDSPGYQPFQAKVAVGAGGLTGQGWLEGTQTRYGLLPEAHTDFLYPSIAEQFGFLGAFGIVIVYGLVCLLGIDVSFSTTEPYGKLLVVGVVSLLAAQSFLNIAMSIGLMPITGIPLPLMSYGGSSLVSSFLALGLLCNIALRRLYLIAPRPFEWRE